MAIHTKSLTFIPIGDYLFVLGGEGGNPSIGHNVEVVDLSSAIPMDCDRVEDLPQDIIDAQAAFFSRDGQELSKVFA